jgi:hypothetical protein
MEEEEKSKRRSLETMVSPGHGTSPCNLEGGALSFFRKGSGNFFVGLKPKTLKTRSKRMVAQILTILVMILLPAGGFGASLSEELYNQPVPSLNEKIVMVTDFIRAFHIYECLVAVRIEEGVTFDIELNDPNDQELKRMQDFLGNGFSRLKRHGFSRLSIRIGETRYIWEVK